jgi:hypothetical protein
VESIYKEKKRETRGKEKRLDSPLSLLAALVVEESLAGLSG